MRQLKAVLEPSSTATAGQQGLDGVKSRPAAMGRRRGAPVLVSSGCSHRHQYVVVMFLGTLEQLRVLIVLTAKLWMVALPAQGVFYLREARPVKICCSESSSKSKNNAAPK